MDFVFFLVTFRTYLRLVRRNDFVRNLEVGSFFVRFLPSVPEIDGPGHVKIRTVTLVVKVLRDSALVIPLPILVLFRMLGLTLVPEVLFVVDLTFNDVPFYGLRGLILRCSLLF